MKNKISMTVLFLAALGACSTKIPASRCEEVVKHAESVLGDKAKKRTEMMAECKAATDAQRGCVLEAKNGITLLGCL